MLLCIVGVGGELQMVEALISSPFIPSPPSDTPHTAQPLQTSLAVACGSTGAARMPKLRARWATGSTAALAPATPGTRGHSQGSLTPQSLVVAPVGSPE